MGVQWDIDFDYDKFEKALYKASMEVFTDIQESHPNEIFYNFSLYSTAQFDYLVPTCNSEEGLTRVSQRYLNQYNERTPGNDVTLEEVRISLRCGTPADFAYHSLEEHDMIFEPAGKLLDEFNGKLEALSKKNEQFIGEEGRSEIQLLLFSRIEIIMLKVMTQLDSLHIFEKTNNRDKIALGLRFGDQSDLEIARYTCMLNSFDVYYTFMSDLKRSHRMGRDIFDKVYK